MSNAILTIPPGLSWGSSRSPVWSTISKEAVSGRATLSSNFSYPMWSYKLKFEFLRARTAFPEMQALAGFYNARNGGADTWLFNDVDDNTCVAQLLGLGDGISTDYQLVRAFGGYTEPIFEPNVITSVTVNGSPVAYTHLGAGLVRLTVAPAGGQTIAWNGTFYWRCRFMQDNLSFEQFMRQLWQLGTLEFKTWKP